MTRRYALVGFVLIAVVLGGCTTETSSSIGLQYEDTFMAEGPSSNLQPVDDPTFTAGDRASLVIQDVTGFVAEDGEVAYRIDMTVTGPDGEVIQERSVNGTASTSDLPLLPHGFINIQDSMEPGQYEMSVSVHDRNGDGRASASSTFQVEGTSGNDTDGTDETGDNGDSDETAQLTWETYTNDAWNYSIDHPASWNVSAGEQGQNELNMNFRSPGGANYIVSSQRLTKQGLENWTQATADSIQNENVTTTISDGQILTESRRIDIDRSNSVVQQRMVLTVEEYPTYETLYTLTFSARESGFETTWTEVFEPALQSFETQE